MPRALTLLFLGFSLFFPSAHCDAVYTDEVAVPVERVWQAALRALESYGMAKQDSQKRTLESSWFEDRVRRTHKFLPESIKGSYLRRYKLTVTLEEVAGKTAVTVKGKFQQKEGGLPPAAPWRPIRPKLEDYEVEKQLFMRILAQLDRDFSSASR